MRKLLATLVRSRIFAPAIHQQLKAHGQALLSLLCALDEVDAGQLLMVASEAEDEALYSFCITLSNGRKDYFVGTVVKVGKTFGGDTDVVKAHMTSQWTCRRVWLSRSFLFQPKGAEMMLIVLKIVEPTVVERWVDYNDKIKIVLRGIESKEYQIGLERARRLLNKSDSSQSLNSLTATATATDETEFGIQAQLLGRYIVKGWQGDVKDSDGQTVAYTPEAAIAMINKCCLLFVGSLAGHANHDRATR